MLHFMMWLIMSLHGLMAAWWFIQSVKLKKRHAQHAGEMRAYIEESLASLSKLPEWRDSYAVLAFLADIARRRDLPEDLREDAKLLMPIDAAAVLLDHRAPLVH